MKKCLSVCLALILMLSAFSAAFSAAAEDLPNVSVQFDNAQSAAAFWGANNLLVQYNGSERAVQLTAVGAEDPYVSVNLGSACVEAAVYPYVVLTYRLPATNVDQSGNAELFWMLDNQFPSAARRLPFQMQSGYKYRAQILDLSANDAWTGRIARLRIDPFLTGENIWDTMLLSSIVFCPTQSAAAEAAAAQTALANGVLNEIPEETFARNTYDLQTYMQPIWQGNIVYNETVLPVANADGSVPPLPLLYSADRVVSVRNGLLNTEYQLGRDYDVQNGQLVIPAGSRIPVLAYSDMHSDTQQNTNWWPCMDGTYTFMAEGAFFHTLQLAVTYTHSDAWTAAAPVSRTNTLVRTATKLRNKQDLRVVFNGDSITVGGNSSAFVGAEPYCPNWADMTIQALKAEYNTNAITYVNTAVGGTMSDWGLQNVSANITQYAPDLLILGFGMNDLTLGVSAQDFQSNIRGILTAVRAANPSCEVILISSMIPNPAIFGMVTDTQTAYLAALLSLASEFAGVAVADMTTLHRSLLTRKSFADMTGNNINHTNDFMTRAYAQTLTAMLCGVDPDRGTPTTGVTTFVACGDGVYGDTYDQIIAAGIGNTAGIVTDIGSVSVQTIHLLGWLASSKDIVRFGYRCGSDVVMGDWKFTTEDAVIQAGLPITQSGGETSRFLIDVPIRFGTNVTVTALAELADGSVIEIWTVTYSASAATLLNHYFDAVLLDYDVLHGTGDTDVWLESNPIHFAAGAYASLNMRGWALLSKSISAFVYRIDGGMPVGGNFFEDRPDVKQALGDTAEGFLVTADVSALSPGSHVAEVVAIAADGTPVVVYTVPFFVLGGSGITLQGDDAVVLTTDGLSYTARGFSSVVGGERFRITNGFVMTPGGYRSAGSFNRMGFSYSSTRPLRMTVVYVQDGSAITDVFYLDAAEDGEFHALIQGYLSGAQASAIRSVRFDSCTGEAADVFLQNIVTEDYTVYDQQVYYLTNARFRVGILLSWGGGISYIEDRKHTETDLQNLINNYDTGRLVQQSYYGAGLSADYVPGVYNDALWCYNPVQGGDMYQNPSRLIDFVPGDGTAYIKVQPQDWSTNGLITPSYMENVYTLYEDHIGVDNRFTDYSGLTHPLAAQEIPAFYTVSYLDRFTCYLGTNPWTGDTLTNRDDLNFWGDAQYSDDCTFVPPQGDTETWCAWTSSRNGFGIGLYVPGISMFKAGRFSYDGSKSPGSASTNYVAPLTYMTMQSYEPFEYSYQITTGTVSQIRDTFYALNVEPTKVNVSFYAEDVPALDDKAVVIGGVYGELPVPERDGYIFRGWYTQPDGGTLVTAETTVTAEEDHTLYASWEEVVITEISVLALPSKTVYTEGETLNTDGMALRVSLSDGKSFPLVAGFTCDPVLLDDAGTQTITVTYEGFTTTFDVQVQEPIPTEYSPRFTLRGGTTRPGCEVDVTVEMTNNPGLVSAMIDIEYDRDVLELVRVRDGGLLGERTMATVIRLDTIPYMVSWIDDTAAENHTENGTLVTFTFRVREDAAPGSTPITLHSTRDSTRDLAGNRYRFAVTDGSVEITNHIPGDVDADGRLDLKDATQLARYLVGGWNVTIDESCADVNGDSCIDQKDVVCIRRFLAGGWEITLI